MWERLGAKREEGRKGNAGCAYPFDKVPVSKNLSRPVLAPFLLPLLAFKVLRR